jgi:hypothetical protein
MKITFAILVMIAVVVVIVPIAVGVPAMIVFVPPTMIRRVAALTLRMQLVAPMVGLTALRPVMLDGFVEVVIDFGDALLAFIIGPHDWGSSGEGKETHHGRRGQRSLTVKRKN